MEIHETVQHVFGKHPCWWQVKAALEIWERKVLLHITTYGNWCAACVCGLRAQGDHKIINFDH